MTSSNRTLQLDKENAKWLGVCAGIARFLDVKPWAVRMVAIGCLLFGAWPLVPGYFLTWYLLNNKKSGQIRDTFIDNSVVNHFRSVDYRKKLYRDPANGKVGGVCAGIADYLEVDASVVRIVFIVLTGLAGFPMLFYIGAMLVLEKKPEEPYRWNRTRRTAPGSEQRSSGPAAAGAQPDYTQQSPEQPRRTSRNNYRDEEPPLRDQYSQRREFQYCARKFALLQQRLARVEAYVTSPKFKLHREFRNM